MSTPDRKQNKGIIKMEDFMFADGLVSENELEHIGVARKSGRYPWGSGENPYHHGASAPGGFRARMAEKKARKRAEVQAKSMREAKAKKAEEARQEADAQKAKEEAIASGDPKKIAPYIHSMTDDELRSVTARLQLEVNLRDVMMKKDPSFGKSKVDRAIATLDKTTKQANTAIDAYNTMARVLNGLKGTSMPIIPKGDGGKNKKQKQSDKDTKNNNNKKNKKQKLRWDGTVKE